MKLVALLSLLLSITGCERRTVVKFEGGNPPVFVMSGSGDLADLIIYGPEQEQIKDPFDRTHAIWEIVPIKGYLDGEPVESLHRIEYGSVPKGYKQVRPETNMLPPPLVPGKRYRYWFQTTNAPHAGGYFEIRDDKAVAVEGP